MMLFHLFLLCTVYLWSYMCVCFMTQYYVVSVGTKSVESFPVNPIWSELEEVNNHQFLHPPPLVWEFVD